MGLKRNPDGTYEVPIRDRKKTDGEQVQVAVVFGILLCTLLLLVFGLLLLILPTFRVKRIEVKGNKVTPEEAIVEAMGIRIGDETFSINWGQAAENLKSDPKCRSVRAITLKHTFRTVTVTVEEDDILMVTSVGQSKFTFDRDLRARDYSTDESAFSDCIPVKLPNLYGAFVVGEVLPFENSEIDKSYIIDFFNALDGAGEWYRVSAIDASKKTYLSFDRDKHIRIILGTLKNFENKLALADQILNEEAVKSGEYVIVDVSNTKKPTRRTVSWEDFRTSGDD